MVGAQGSTSPHVVAAYAFAWLKRRPASCCVRSTAAESEHALNHTTRENFPAALSEAWLFCKQLLPPASQGSVKNCLRTATDSVLKEMLKFHVLGADGANVNKMSCVRFSKPIQNIVS